MFLFYIYFFHIKKYQDLIKTHENRINLSEQGLVVTNNSYSDLKHKITSIAKTLDQYQSRNKQLERKRERLSTELIKQSSHLESLESQIQLVREIMLSHKWIVLQMN